MSFRAEDMSTGNATVWFNFDRVPLSANSQLEISKMESVAGSGRPGATLRVPIPFRYLDTTQERVLRLLSIAQRPLYWAEIQRALCLVAHEFSLACEWLTDRGYIEPSGGAREALWTLTERGRLWVEVTCAR